jgi:hypothetical protein
MVEPLSRLLYGQPLNDELPFQHDGMLERKAEDDDLAIPAQLLENSDTEARQRSCAFVLVADGVGGLDLRGTALRYVLGAEGLSYAFHVFPWGHGFGRWFADLIDVPNRDGQAAQLAAAVSRFRARQTDVPVFLAAKSGGSGVVIKALEQLDEGSVERTILLAPALSPDYDLTAALRALSPDMVGFWSPFEVFLLGVGTRVFGTADRVKTASAGMVGFRVPPYSRGLRPIPSAPASTPSRARCDGPREWRRPVTWEVISDRILRFFSRSTSYPCCGPGRATSLELRSTIKPVRWWADILMARYSRPGEWPLLAGCATPSARGDLQGLRDQGDS